ncbi:MAG: M48 family peptidase, partial [Betaproteobacteria bacterium]
MRIPAVCLGLALLVPQARAQTLPELGDTSGALLSPYLERKIGEQAMREIRLREPTFLDDPELTEYVNEVGGRIVAA